jgi:hypothetical protein
LWSARPCPQLLLPHREPLALFFVEIELGDGSGFRRSLVRYFYSPEIGRAADDRLVSGGLEFKTTAWRGI